MTDPKAATLSLLDRRAPGATICPSEVARSIAQDWRNAMPVVHEAIDELVSDGLVQLSWNASLKRRFFWGVRTSLIATAADKGSPAFSAELLEASSSIDGLADLLQRRATASFEECRALVARMDRALPDLAPPILTGDELRGVHDSDGMIASDGGDL